VPGQAAGAQGGSVGLQQRWKSLFESVEDAATHLPRFIEAVYNGRRLR
jgi:hypothetical protein